MKIADLFVLFSVKGVETVKAASQVAKTSLETIQKGADAARSALTIFTSTAGVAAGAILGLATAGVAASTQGQILSFQMERLSRVVAGMFGPEIQKLIGFITDLTNWITALTDRQKQMIVFATLAVVGIIAISGAVIALIASVATLVTSLGALYTAIVAVESATGVGLLLPVIGAAIALVGAAVISLIGGLIALFTLTTSGKNALAGLWASLQPIREAFSRLTDILSSLWDRFTELLQPIMRIGGAFMETLGAGLQVAVELFGAAMTVVEAFIRLLTGAALGAESGIIGTLKTITRLLQIMAGWIATATAGLRGLLGLPAQVAPKSFNERSEAPKAIGGPEGVHDTWTRIAQASRLVGAGTTKPVEEQQLDELKNIAKNTNATHGALNAARPVLNRG